jgi:hypothetical protein
MVSNLHFWEPKSVKQKRRGRIESYDFNVVDDLETQDDCSMQTTRAPMEARV